MKYILPTLGAVAAVSLFALSNANQTAIAVERPSYDETFKQLELFADVLARVDPHSSYIGPDAFKEHQISTSGEYGGLGMEVTTEDGFVKVITPIDESPAKKAGIKAGDYITEIEGDCPSG